MSRAEAQELIRAIADISDTNQDDPAETKLKAQPTRIARIDPNYAGVGLPKVQFEDEAVMTTKVYKTVNPAYVPTANQRVIMMPIGRTYMVLGPLLNTPGPVPSTPAAVTGLVVNTSAYLDQKGKTAAAVAISWNAVSQNVDGTAITDLAGYRVSWQYTSITNDPGTKFLPDTPNLTAAISGLIPLAGIKIGVAAVNKQGTVGAFTYVTKTLSNNTTLPPVPSTPLGDNYLGLARATWDGNDSSGNPMPVDFSSIEVHWSTTSGFTPDATTYTGSLNAPGASFYPKTVTYGTPYYIKFIAVNQAGNKSAPSAQGTATPAQLVNIDLGPNAVDTANIRNAAIKNAQIDQLAVNDINVSSVNVGKLTAGYLNAQVLLGNQIATALSGTRIVLDSAGFHMYYGSGSTPVIDFNANGNALFTGNISASAITGSSFQTISSGGGSVTMGLNDRNRINFFANNTSAYPTPGFVGVDIYGTGVVSIRGVIPSNNSTTGARMDLASDGSVSFAATAMTLPYATITNSLSIGSSLGVTGYATFSSGMSVSGYLQGGNAAQFSGNITSTGGGLFANTSVNGSTLNISNGAAVGGTFSAGNGNFAVAAAGYLTINNAMQTAGSYNITAGGNMYCTDMHASGGVYGTNHLTTSSKVYKSKVKKYQAVDNVLNMIRPVQFQYKKDPGKKIHIGVIAEDLVGTELEHCVAFNEDGKAHAVDYSKLNFAAILSMAKEVETLKSKVLQLESR